MTEEELRILNFVFPVESRQIQHFGTSLEMLAWTASRLLASEGYEHIAYLESWMVNARALIEFFGYNGEARRARDFSAASLLAGHLSEIDDALREVWTVASQHVVHMSLARTPQNIMAFEDAPEFEDRIPGTTRQLLGMASRFVLAAEKLEMGWAALAGSCLSEAESMAPIVGG